MEFENLLLDLNIEKSVVSKIEDLLTLEKIILNNNPVDDFDGITPEQMHYLLYDLHSDKSLVRFNIAVDNLKDIPLLKLVEHFLILIKNEKEIKLTARGNLPPVIVKELYSQKYIPEDSIDHGITKLTKETDSQTVELTKILCDISGLTKKRNNKLSLTSKAFKITDKRELFTVIFENFRINFNWAYFDAYPGEETGQIGFGFSLYLLKKYGGTERLDTFYSEKYFKAFPMLRVSSDGYDSNDSCYSTRTFDRFLDYCGLIKINRISWEEKYIKKSDLFDKIIISPNAASGEIIH